jgi:hypothetical protein
LDNCIGTCADELRNIYNFDLLACFFSKQIAGLKHILCHHSAGGVIPDPEKTEQDLQFSSRRPLKI